MRTRGNRVNVSFEGIESMELPAIDFTGETIDITCGLLAAKLHRERFICPGINRECIEYEGHLITPKAFYVMADKGSLKDWKNAIRINGKKIRRYIDSGELDFYNHSKLCTGRCKSRISQKFSLPDSLANLSAHQATKPQNSSKHDQTETNDALSVVPSTIVDQYGEEPDVKPNLEQLQLLNLLHLQPGTNGEMPSAAGDTTTPIHIVNVQSTSNTKDDDVLFWRAIVQLGLVDEFFREVKAKLDVLKANMVKNFVPVEDAKKASRIVNELGMRSKLDMKLTAHKYEFDRQRDKLEREMEALKRKVSEYEQKTEILKQKSDCYEQLMTKKLKLDEIPSSSLDAHDLRHSKAISPTSAVFANGDSRSTSPFPSQDSADNSVSHDMDNSSDSVVLNSQESSVLISQDSSIVGYQQSSTSTSDD